MNVGTLSQSETKPIIYPDSDGQPMADNTLQFRWIVTIEGGLEAVFADDPNVFVAGDLLWYPVEGMPKIRQAPDVLTAFGRPKGYRGSYKQWEEGDIPPQVVWEIMSPGNTLTEMIRKFQFYETYGVEEYYIYDPDAGELSGWLREGAKLKEIPNMQGWVSPRLKVLMQLESGELKLYAPEGRPFATFVEIVAQRDQAEKARELAEKEREQVRQENQQLRDQLKAMGIDPKI
jgi:Uma2 family endonuclease